MDRFFPGPLADRVWNVMRGAGYGQQKADGSEIAFTRRLTGTPFPRLHAYVEERGGGARVSLHIDQRQPSYEGSKAHGGEYAGPLLEREMDRLATFFRPRARTTPDPSLKRRGGSEEPEKGFFSRLFGG